MNQREAHIIKINKESPYKQINITDKNHVESNKEMMKLSSYYNKNFSIKEMKKDPWKTPKGSVNSTANQVGRDSHTSGLPQEVLPTEKTGYTGYTSGQTGN